MTSLRFPLLLVASLAVSLAAGCGQPTDDEDEPGESSASALAELSFQPVRATLPIKEDALEIFASEKELRDYFGTSCGLLCRKAWDGPLPFTIAEGESVVLISRAGSAPGKGFDIARTYKGGNRKWLRAETCANNSRVPYALAKFKPDFLTIWASDEGPAASCR